jgi:CheY-like chemotaxis protein
MAPVALSDIYEDAERAFRQVAEQKGLDFIVEIDPALPSSIVSDEQRLGQILKNLLSNAFKFTSQGGVSLAIGHPGDGVAFRSETLRAADEVISLAVIDTGVGISDDKLSAIFEAFQQADGTTSRKYGGTGLGLSISREIARLLGGEIQVESVPGEGSTFVLFLPLTERVVETAIEPRGVGEPALLAGPANGNGAPPLLVDEPPADDSAGLVPDDRVVLVIDSKSERARALLDAVHSSGAKGVIAARPTAGLGMAREHRPAAVILAGEMARVEPVLGQLKKHPDTRHVPIVMIGDPAARMDALRAGAAVFVEEPLDGAGIEQTLAELDRLAELPARRIALIEEQDERLDDETVGLLTGDHVELVRIDPADALDTLRGETFDLAVVVLGRNRANTTAILRDVTVDEELRERRMIAYLPAKLSNADRARLDALSKTAVMVVADSRERLVDRAAVFLHRVEAQLPTPTRRMLGALRTGNAQLEGRKVLVIDDDIRNVFALTSTLEQRGMKVVFAENGREGIDRLLQHANTDLILLDIMMPEMDGYETARAIRSMPRFEHLPIISLTAKAMKGDREKAIAAGASDYITKPVDVDQLVSMMRVWLDV